jgi:hypothetical protein
MGHAADVIGTMPVDLPEYAEKLHLPARLTPSRVVVR